MTKTVKSCKYYASNEHLTVFGCQKAFAIEHFRKAAIVRIFAPDCQQRHFVKTNPNEGTDGMPW